MKKIYLIVTLLILTGCAAASSNTILQGKTDADWEAAEKYCIERSGLKTGFVGQMTPFAITNISAREEYRKCLIETGWLVEK